MRFDVVSSGRQKNVGICPFCCNEGPLTFHHLIPRKVHRRTRFKKNYDRLTLNRGIYLCRLCHSGIHSRYDEMQLAHEFSTPEALGNDPGLQRHFHWVAKQRRC